MKIIFFLLILVSNALAETKLLLIGGGKRPAEAMQEFVSLAGADKSRILIIPWASASLEGAENIKKELLSSGAIDVSIAGLTLTDIDSFTGIFFTGGDQNVLMTHLLANNLIEPFRQRFIQGVVFGGTSAGTAIMSDPMINGETPVGLVTGLGLLPAGIIVDQHFIVRQRFNRLAGLILERGGMGIGVDEGTSFLILGKFAKVIGPSKVIIIQKSNVTELNPGDFFDMP
ncbi:MAG TPA: cyanophycinase [Bacteriovoracaceae bacterium]|nr:cyanophycinase [Bacteriovoracaceae bacterium]